jgi:hypothetical protein
MHAPPLPPHPEPPDYLSPEAAKHWRQIITSRPPDYFDVVNQHFLAMLCHHIATAGLIWREINAIDPSDAKQLRRYRSLLTMASRESRMTSLMLTKLRLLPTRYMAEKEAAAVPSIPWARHV